jgi:hypothetical protein
MDSIHVILSEEGASPVQPGITIALSGMRRGKTVPPLVQDESALSGLRLHL